MRSTDFLPDWPLCFEMTAEEVGLMKDQVEELRRKYRKGVFVLGELIYKLYESGSVRFVYTSEGIEEEREVDKMLRLLDYMSARIAKLEETYSSDELSE